MTLGIAGTALEHSAVTGCLIPRVFVLVWFFSGFFVGFVAVVFCNTYDLCGLKTIEITLSSFYFFLLFRKLQNADKSH